ncbi:flagellin [Bacillus sp. RO3]|nr:flagellin [Bacillus sp. RO3]
MRINHNIAALNTYRQLNSASTGQAKSMEKLSSGLRINRAGDDAAGLAISEKMRGQIRGLDQASRNAQDGISLIQTAEGALNETHSILQRMRELAVQSSNDTNTDADRTEIQKEVNQLADEMNRIGNNTEFNTKSLLDGSLNKTEATAAKFIGNSVAGGNIEIRSTATKTSASGVTLTPAVDIHGAEAGKFTSTTAYATAAGPNVTAADNELTVSVTAGGTTDKVTINLAAKNYDGTAGNTKSDFATDLAAAINAATGTNDVTVGFDANNKLVISTSATGSGTSVRIDGGNMATHFGAVSNANYADGIAANDSLSIDVDGVTKTHSLTNKVYNTVDELVTELNTQFTADGITFSNDSGSIKVESNVAGSTSTLANFTGSAASALGLTNAAVTDGQDVNNTIQFKVDGSGAYTATIADGNYSSRDVLAATIQNALNNASTGSEADVSVKADGDRFVLDSGSTGTSSKIEIVAANADLGLAARAEAGNDGQNVELNFAIGANEGQNLKLSIADMRSSALGISGAASGADTFTGVDGSTVDANYSSNSVDNKGTAEYVISVSTAEDAENAITVIDNAIQTVSQERSKLGAYQNRLEHTINNLGTSSENLTAAESRVRDVDMAKEMMNQTKNSILSQAAQAMLAQANQQPQGVLQLLR